MGQRIVRPSFSTTSGGLNVTASMTSNSAPPGCYMLFILNSTGVPSVAKFVKLAAAAPTPTPTPSPTATPTATSTPTVTPTPTATPSPTPTPTVTPTPTLTPTPSGSQLSGMTVVTAPSGAVVGAFTNGYNYDIGNSLSVRADPLSGVASVVFKLDGKVIRKENMVPYSVAGDNNGSYTTWRPAVGDHALIATPFSATGGTGTAGTPVTITFTVINSGATPTPTPSPTATVSSRPTPPETPIPSPTPESVPVMSPLFLLRPRAVAGRLTLLLLMLPGFLQVSGRAHAQSAAYTVFELPGAGDGIQVPAC